MNIKKNSQSSVIIESTQQEAKIENLFYNGTIVSKLNLPGNIVEISKPGDYEYNHVGFTGFEVAKESYKGVINLMKLVLEDIKVVVLFADSEISKDIQNDLGYVDILITPFFSSSRLKEHIADIDPKTVILLKNFESSVEFDLEDMKKNLGVSNIEEAGSYKFKSSDFGSDDEYTLSTSILK